ncbi:MAG: anthranilate synthase component I family protein [Ekhidna sp.]|nr:anthranilate synthase component I family protein [Ekhidna sp.]MBC6409797.1 anthranilate synthase component I family protein [Ekhidna sp.]MBC6425195.1 anthranilate synthase component I family protein [Ekhidna sp.]
MKKIKLKTRKKSFLADTITPVSVYLKLRDRFSNSFLLESSDYHGSENSFSYICCDPMASIKIEGNKVSIYRPSEKLVEREWTHLREELNNFTISFEYDNSDVNYIESGLFGYMNYDIIDAFEALDLDQSDDTTPLAQYHLFRFVIALDHFKNECHLIETYISSPDEGLFREVNSLIQQRNIPFYPFRTTGKKISNQTDADYLKMVKKGIHHCNIGDVFQVVLSRNFTIPFQGDEFQVYRTLRSVNPSPYLFYFDYGSFRIFGSSPEAQIVLKDGKAEIYPIAGTFRRTGNDRADSELAEKLLKDPKEDSEHVMLVDLARNDLSHSCENVKVEIYKEVQYYSHVIHLVSKVTGKIKVGASFMDIVAETFPAGTLSGAPKIRAMQIIDENEKTPRGFYGGAVGFMDFRGNFNHAIMIRSFKSRNNELKFQAGAGIVSQSIPENELQEVFNKVGALEHAVNEAGKI